MRRPLMLRERLGLASRSGRPICSVFNVLFTGWACVFVTMQSYPCKILLIQTM